MKILFVLCTLLAFGCTEENPSQLTATLEAPIETALPGSFFMNSGWDGPGNYPQEPEVLFLGVRALADLNPAGLGVKNVIVLVGFDFAGCEVYPGTPICVGCLEDATGGCAAEVVTPRVITSSVGVATVAIQFHQQPPPFTLRVYAEEGGPTAVRSWP